MTLKKLGIYMTVTASRFGSGALAHTYAIALDQTDARTFRAITTLNNYTSYSTDATISFAETPPLRLSMHPSNLDVKRS